MLRGKEEELRVALEACRKRVRELETAVTEGGEREDNLRGVVRVARYGRETSVAFTNEPS